jgi:hypothetical protein
MAAGLGFKTFTTGEVLTAADTNGYLMQGVLVFASAAARDAAITSPQEGQCCYLKDTDAVLTYSGAAWVGFDDSNAIQNSIVDAKGDLVAASGADTPARLAVGADGSSIVADSAATTGLRYSATPSASNPIINSAFQIAQRGTSGFTANGFTLDRWFINGAANMTLSRQATSDTTNLPFIQYCARIARTAGSTSTVPREFTQSLESVNAIPFAGKTVTVSFYARAGANYSSTSNALSLTLVSGTGTDQNRGATAYTGEAYPASVTTTLTTTWQRFSATGTVAATATELAIYNVSTPTGTAGANDYYEITGVQIDIGSVALPFRTYAATIQGELAACQRYYVRLGANSGGTTGAYSTYGNGYSTQTTDASINITLPTTMRIPPTVCEFSNVAIQDFNTAVIAVSNVTMNSAFVSTTVAVVAATTVGATQFRGCKLCNNNNTAGYVGFSAEL